MFKHILSCKTMLFLSLVRKAMTRGDFIVSTFAIVTRTFVDDNLLFVDVNLTFVDAH